MSYTYSFEKLSVWKSNRQFTKRLYSVTKTFPKEEQFGITSQVSRTTVSISCNLAEGSARVSNKEQNRFYEIAFGSAVEVVNLMILSNDLEMLSDNDYVSLRNEIEKITFDISTLIKNNKKVENR